MKIVLIGATGQVGYALAPALIGAGHDVTVLVRDGSRLPFSQSIRVVAEPEFNAQIFGGVLKDMDCVVYGVGLPEQFAVDTGVFDRVNRGILTKFLSALEASTVRRPVYISTFEVFAPRDGVIRESHPVAPLDGLSPYFTAMTLAYQDVTEFARRTQTQLTTIHPAAVYGGLNTGHGFTGVIENLLNWRVWRLPAVPSGRFPLVHADSLAQGVASALHHEGPFILSDEMCDLPTLARTLRRDARSYVRHPQCQPPLPTPPPNRSRPWDVPFTAIQSFPGCSLTSSARALNRSLTERERRSDSPPYRLRRG
jgi:nucleoside-diphosphate-sugar epimerase